MSKAAKNILTLNHEEAMDFFMKSEQYPFLGEGVACSILDICTLIVKEIVICTFYAFSHVRNKVQHDITDDTKKKWNSDIRGLYSGNDSIVKVTNHG